MNKSIITIFLIALICLGFTGFNSKTGSEIGKYAPSVQFTKEFENTTYRVGKNNKPVLLSFWSFKDASSRLRNKQYQIAFDDKIISDQKIDYISVNIDEKKSVVAEIIDIDKLDKNTQYHPVNEPDKVIKDYGLNDEIKTFLLDSNGEIIAINPEVSKLLNL